MESDKREDPDATEEVASVSRPNRIHFLDLFDIILQEIVDFLDIEALIVVGQVNARLRRLALNSVRNLKIQRVTPAVLEFLREHGSLVRRLDLSNSKSPWPEVATVIGMCLHVKELNLSNANQGSFNDLNVGLNELEKLHLSILYRTTNLECAKWLKELHIDLSFFRETDLINLLNLCSSIEVLFANLLGMGRVSEETEPVMIAERWSTLHTVVFSRHLSPKNSAQRLLRRIFAHNRSPGVRRWIERDQVCYIYEHGHFNGEESVAVPAKDYRVKYLKRFDFLYLSDDQSLPEISERRWGPPRCIRVATLRCLTLDLNEYLTTALRELDIRGCHGKFSQSFRLGLLSASPFLEKLVCNVCFFLSPRRGDNDPDIVSSSRRVMRKMKLKQLFVRGFCHEWVKQVNHPRDGSNCSRCSSIVRVTSSALVGVEDLEYLDEMTLQYVNLGRSGFLNLANPRLRVLRLRLLRNNNFSVLHKLLQKCQNLRYLQLEALDLPLHSVALWKALSRDPSLRQVCLRSATKFMAGGTDELFKYIRKVFLRLEHTHVHTLDTKRSSGVISFIWNCFKTFDFQKIQLSEDETLPPPFEFISWHGSSEPGRGLCFPGASLGVALPKTWPVE